MYVGYKVSPLIMERYGIDLAQGIIDLHSKDILVLNLKPFNFLLSENDQAVISNIGIPYALLGIPDALQLEVPNALATFLFDPSVSPRLGTPNYMSPEQWEPKLHGPVCFETDSWAFGCSILEMFSGVQPWKDKSAKEIYHLVVNRKEKPRIPDGLPLALENIIICCFEYDPRNRPLMRDILDAFKSFQNAVSRDGRWAGRRSRAGTEKTCGISCSDWSWKKDRLQKGDVVRFRKLPNSCETKNMDAPCGTVMSCEDGNVFILVRVDESTIERVTYGFAAGDWVSLKIQKDFTHSRMGIIHSINRDGSVAVGFVGLETLWKGHISELQAEDDCIWKARIAQKRTKNKLKFFSR